MRMKIAAFILSALLLAGCSEPERVSAAEFKKLFTEVGVPQTVRHVTYLGERDGRCYIKISSISPLSKTWSEHIVYVEVGELDVAFRSSLPRGPNQTVEPTRGLGLRFRTARVRSTWPCNSKSSAGAEPRVAHL